MTLIHIFTVVMPIRFDLEKIRKTSQCVNYFETGLFNPQCEVSLKRAIRSGFEKVYSIEIRKEWVDNGFKIFKKQIDEGICQIYHDDSSNMSKYLNGPEFQNKTLFFLDAHVDSDNITHYKKKCPLFDELEAISKLDRKDHVICVDDVRILKQEFPWGERSYGDLDFLEQIKEKILTINTNYKFNFLKGHVPEDVLIAYIP